MPQVTLQVVPFARGGHAGASGSFTVLRFEEQCLPDVVYIEQLTGAVYLEQRVGCRALPGGHGPAQRRGADPGRHARFIEQVASETMTDPPRLTPAWRTRPGSMTTCSAARTTTPPTGRPPRPALKVWPEMRLRRPGEPGVPRARRPLPRRGGGDPAVPRHRHRHPDGGQHPPGRPGDRARVPGRLRGLRPGRARPRPRPADQQRGRRHRVHRRRPARHRRDPHPGRRAARLQPAGGGHADRDPARDTGLRRPVRDRGQADGRRPARQLPRHLPRRRRTCSNRKAQAASRPVEPARSSSGSPGATASRWRGSSTARTW